MQAQKEKAILEIDGVEYPRLLSVSYNIYTIKDDQGKPADIARAGTITITKESTNKNSKDITRWACDSSEANYKSGKITFKDPHNKLLRTLEWENGFITNYEEHLGPAQSGEQMYQVFVVSAQKIKVEDAEVWSWPPD